MRKRPAKEMVVLLETPEGKEQEWVLIFDYYPGSPGSYWQPPDSPEVEFISAEYRQKGQETVKLTADEFEKKFSITEDQWDSWYYKACEQVENEDYDYDEP